jgi:HrpA-like RNA helicase
MMLYRREVWPRILLKELIFKFRNAPILVVHGRQHPVNVRHVSQSQDDWLSAVQSTIFQIHREAAPQ